MTVEGHKVCEEQHGTRVSGLGIKWALNRTIGFVL